MSQNGMRKYQVGTALVSGKQSIILASQGKFFDLHRLLQNAKAHASLSLEVRGIPASLLELVENWPYWNEKLAQIVNAVFADDAAQEVPGTLHQGELQWLAPLLYPRKLICIGTNYRDHITEMGVSKLPKYPYSFLKPATTTLIGSGVTLELPGKAKQVDWEAELAVVIGHSVTGSLKPHQ